MDHLNKQVQKDMVDGLLKLHFGKNILGYTYQKGKQVGASFKYKNIVPTNSPYNCFIWIFLAHLET